jgi:GT2 family glycosyltransferase
MTTLQPSVSIVVATVGRPGLGPLLESLVATDDGRPEVVVVDDRPGPVPPLPVGPWVSRVVASGGRGSAAARNAGLRAASGDWVVFLDDDVELTRTWYADLCRDLAHARADVAGVHGGIPVPHGDERSVTGSGTPAPWLTVDMAYRRMVLLCLGGFEERFPRACREDAELALRVARSGWRLVHGGRSTRRGVHPRGRLAGGTRRTALVGVLGALAVWPLRPRTWPDDVDGRSGT